MLPPVVTMPCLGILCHLSLRLNLSLGSRRYTVCEDACRSDPSRVRLWQPSGHHSLWKMPPRPILSWPSTPLVLNLPPACPQPTQSGRFQPSALMGKAFSHL